MVELVGDMCIPSELIIPIKTGAEIAAMTNRDGLLVYNSTTSKLNFNTGVAWVVVTSA